MNPHKKLVLSLLAERSADSAGERQIALINGVFSGTDPMFFSVPEELPKLSLIHELNFQIHSFPNAPLTFRVGLTTGFNNTTEKFDTAFPIIPRLLYLDSLPQHFSLISPTPLKLTNLKIIRKTAYRLFSLEVTSLASGLNPFSAWMIFSKIDDSFSDGLD